MKSESGFSFAIASRPFYTNICFEIHNKTIIRNQIMSNLKVRFLTKRFKETQQSSRIMVEENRKRCVRHRGKEDDNWQNPSL